MLIINEGVKVGCRLLLFDQIIETYGTPQHTILSRNRSIELMVRVLACMVMDWPCIFVIVIRFVFY